MHLYNDGGKRNAMSCSCGYDIEDFMKFCPQCGVEIIDQERRVIEYYFSRGHEYKAIVQFLSKHHNIKMCERTLKSRLVDYGLRRKLPEYNIGLVRERIRSELDGPGCMGGYRSVWNTLRLEGYQVPRHVVEEIVREMDPEGCEMRKGRRLRRRQYRSPGPNFCWHIDGYDKLKPYGFPIHGCIDGWSRRILWLEVCRSNNNPVYPGIYFFECVKECGGCPMKVRTDCGTENGIIAAMQCEFRGNADAHKYGTSPANQRIEGWWSFLRRNRSTWWMNYFRDLVERELFNPLNELQTEALWYCFSCVIQKDLNKVKEQWNTHRIRKNGHDTVPGVPDELYFLPEAHGGVDDLLLSPFSGLNNSLSTRSLK